MSQSEHAPVRVVIVDDHHVVRAGLKMVLDAHEGIDVVGVAASGEEGFEVLGELFDGPAESHPNVIVMDLVMEGMGGIEATRRLAAERPGLGVLVLTMAEDREHLRGAFAAGAAGYVRKNAVENELVDAIRAIAEGGRYLHPSLGAELIRAEEEARRVPGADKGVGLSQREVEVLRLVAQGFSNREIAEQLFISPRTVDTHRTHIKRKAGLRSRSELTRFAMDAGILKEGG